MFQSQPDDQYTLEMVEALTQPSANFLCPLEANTCNLEFNYFKIRDVSTDQVLYEVMKDPSLRTAKYHFGPLFFELEALGTTLGFRIGAQPIHNLVMLQKHYFKQELIKTVRFQIPFCVPETQNSIETIYEIPKFSEERKQEMISSPWETQADSFYFVEGKLVIHTKALFSYQPFDEAVQE